MTTTSPSVSLPRSAERAATRRPIGATGQQRALTTSNVSEDLIIAVAVLAYENEPYIERLLDRVPALVAGQVPLLLVSDDASSDRTAEIASRWAHD